MGVRFRKNGIIFSSRFIRALIILLAAPLIATSAEPERLTGELFVHDPSTIQKHGSNYFLFSTGIGIATKFSTNRLHWTRGRSVFESTPAWTTNAVPGFHGYFWAPDVVFVNGKYLLYYSVSTFGKQRSAIGLATNPSLETNSSWMDQGTVIESRPGDPFNAIDPSVFLDRDDKLWMVFGSFWRGIYLVELDPRNGKRMATNSPEHRLAWNESIEAPALHRRGDHYYLFVNWGVCCRGTNSTYEIRVGRSKKITGPYLDREGKDLVNRGGTLFLKTEGQDIGPGHIGVFNEQNREFVSYHVYDATMRGRSQLRLRKLRWMPDGWPNVE